MKKRNFVLVKKLLGYISKRDVTALEPGYLIPGSQNILMGDGEIFGVRKGYELTGVASTTAAPITAEAQWKTNRNYEFMLRAGNELLQFYYGGTWYTLLSGLGTYTNFNFTTFWDTTEIQDVLLMVNGETTPNIKEWSGGIATYASSTVNTITKEGTTTWAEEGFYTASTRSIIIGGTTYTYTGGESTTTLTGVTPDPTGAGIVAGTLAYQSVRTTLNSAMTSAPGGGGWTNDIIKVLNNMLYLGCLKFRQINVSKQNNYKDFSFASPRAPGEGAQLIFDAAPVGFEAQEDVMYVAAGDDQFYQITYTLSADQTVEAVAVKRLNTGPQQGAVSQAAMGKSKNKIIFLSNEPTFDELGRVEQINTPQSRPLSETVKTDFDSFDVTGACVEYWRDAFYVLFPAESKMMVYNITKSFWETPQIVPFSRLTVFGGDLYGHSNSVFETYKVFTGTSDNGNPIDARARLAYNNYGDRAWYKAFDEFFSEGYISKNTKLTRKIFYELNGFTSIASKDIMGSTNDILFDKAGGSLGKNSLGKSNLAGSGSDEMPKFRVIHEGVATDFYEMSVEYSSNGIDQRWSILACGPNVFDSPNDNPTKIKK